MNLPISFEQLGGEKDRPKPMGALAQLVGGTIHKDFNSTYTLDSKYELAVQYWKSEFKWVK